MTLLKVADGHAAVKRAMDGTRARGVQFVGSRILNPPAAAGRGGGAGALTPEQQATVDRGGTIYRELCFNCHGDDGHGTPAPGATGVALAPSLVGSPRVNGHRDYVIKAILHGVTGPVAGQSYSQVMVPMGSNSNQWIADVASYVRNSFGNSGAVVVPADVARVRADTVNRSTPWVAAELEASVPRLLVPDATWKVTASHEGRPTPSANAAGGFNFEGSTAGVLSFLGWTTGAPQQAGMWVAIELPMPQPLTEIQFASTMIGGGRAGPSVWTFPRRFQVQVSTDGLSWSAPVAEGEGVPGVTVITFPPVTARFVRITQAATVPDAPPWSMRLLRFYRVGVGRSR